eukprot:PhF_6_TR32992/c0_g1_i1/m.48599
MSHRPSLMETYLTPISTSKVTSRAVTYGSEISMLRTLKQHLENEIAQRDQYIEELRLSVIQLQQENEHHVREIERHESEREYAIRTVEQWREALQEKEREKSEIMETARRDMEALIESQREHCAMMRASHSHEIEKWEMQLSDAQLKVAQLEVSSKDMEASKLLERDSKIKEVQNQLTHKSKELEDANAKIRSLNVDISNLKRRVEDDGKLNQVIESLREHVLGIGSEISRQRHAIKCSILQLGVTGGPTKPTAPGGVQKELTMPSSAIHGDLVDRLRTVSEYSRGVLQHCAEQRVEVAEAMILLLKRKKEEDSKEADREAMRVSERDLFQSRLREIERDRDEERQALLLEREELRKTRQEQELALEKLGIHRQTREVGVQNTLLALQRANVTGWSQTELLSSELEAYDRHMTDLADKVRALERERAKWEQFQTKVMWPG